MNKQQDFETFMKQRQDAATSYVNGDAGPLGRLVARELPATFMGPKGGAVHGTQEVWSAYGRDAEAFEKGGNTELEILDMAESDSIAYWTGYQKALAHMKGVPNPVPMKLRVTELFRREGDTWKMVHRHADPLGDVAESKQG